MERTTVWSRLKRHANGTGGRRCPVKRCSTAFRSRPTPLARRERRSSSVNGATYQSPRVCEVSKIDLRVSLRFSPASPLAARVPSARPARVVAPRARRPAATLDRPSFRPTPPDGLSPARARARSSPPPKRRGRPAGSRVASMKFSHDPPRARALQSATPRARARRRSRRVRTAMRERSRAATERASELCGVERGATLRDDDCGAFLES